MFKRGIALKKHSNYKIGGLAEFFAEPKSVKEIAGLLASWRKDHPGEEVFILGGGTNILFADGVFRGLVLKPKLDSIKVIGTKVTAGASVDMAKLLITVAKRGLSGLEWAGGLPGTLGGAVRGNAGAFRGEIKDSVVSVTSMNFRSGSPKLIKRNFKHCHFGYRNSIFKKNGDEIILEVALKLKKGKAAEIKKVIAEKIKYRHDRHPMNYPSVGSVFKNVDLRHVPKHRHKEFAHVIKTDPFPVIPAAYLISETGVKGTGAGGAMISPRHPNFIVNVSNARSGDVKKLIKLVKSAVKRKFGIDLEEEVLIFS